MIKAGKIIFIVAAYLIALPVVSWSSTDEIKSDTTEAKKAGVMKAYGKLPLYFIENDGQIDKKVRYYERGSGHSTFFTGNGVYLSLIKNIKKETEENNSAENSKDRRVAEKDLQRELIELSFVDAKKNPEITAEGVQEGKVNCFIGNDPEKWRTNVSTYSAVRYKEIYEGMDIRFYGNNRQLEYDLIISPGADPAKAQFSYSGIKGVRITEEGELEIALKEGTIIQKRPYIYQEIEGKRVIRDGNFRLVEDRSEGKDNSFAYGFEVASYDREYPLIIDPVVLTYSTYLGGSGDDRVQSIAVDSSGHAYVTGYTSSTDFPTASAYQGSNAGVGNDVFITKLNAAGSALVYSTYLGGSGGDHGHDIAVDSSGNAYVTGDTYSTDFPTASAYQGYAGNSDVFITKLNAAGSALVYSTYLGGSSSDSGNDIAVDSSGNAYVTGDTYSTDFPTASAYQGYAGNSDVFITKLNAAGSALIYSTYLGGSSSDHGYGITVDSSGNAYVTGYTGSNDFPTASAYQGYAGDSDVFITKLNAAGSALVYSTYLGGSGSDHGNEIAVDSPGNAYVTGRTYSTDFPTASALQGSNAGDSDVFITKLNAAGSALVYSTYLGGSGAEDGNGIAVDSSGSAYVTGATSSTDFPTASALQGSNAGYSDAFITKLNAAGSALVYSTYLGGSNSDSGYRIAVDSLRNAYVTGRTYSTDFPTASALQGSNAGNGDVFITKIFDDDIADITEVIAGAGLTGGGTSGAVTLSVDFADLNDRYVNITGDTMTGPLTVGALIESTSGGIKFPDASTLTSANTINADTVDGLHASAFALSAHLHSGDDITTGTVAEARIDSAIARDSEVSAMYVDITGDTMTGPLSINGSLGIGTTSPAQIVEVARDQLVPRILATGYRDAFSAGSFTGRKARGTMASPSAVQTDDVLASFGGYGYFEYENDPGTYDWPTGSATVKARMQIVAAENWTDAAQGAYIKFFTTPMGTLIRGEVMRITDAGNVGIGTTNPISKLTVEGDINTTGEYKINGISTLKADTSNTFLGPYAGYSNIDGHYNTFNGYQAGYSNTTGLYNTLNGYQAGYSNIDGHYNTFNGYQAGYSNTTGGNNTFNGVQAGFSNTTGMNNTFFGHNAGYSNTTGSINMFIGFQAGYSNIDGNYNTFNGFQAGYSNTTGSVNIFNGFQAGYSNTTGDSNTFIGYRAGYGNSSGASNVFLGYEAGYNETGSDKLYIDTSSTSSPLIWGDFSSDIVAINGSIGVGTSSPSSPLTVVGIIESTSGGIKFPDASILASANTINADTLDGLHSSAFALSAHLHSGNDITSGTLGESYIDALIARDSEIMPTVLANDGSASTLDADMLDGQDSSAFMTSSTDNWVDTTGDTMTGNLLVYGDVDIDQDLYVVGNLYLESDVNAKKNIMPIESSLEKISNIKGVSFAWKDEKKDTGVKHYGVIAQQVEEVLPEIVKKGDDGVRKVAYMELVPVLIEAIKEQQKIYDEKLENQQKIISKLLKRVERLERDVKLNNSVAVANIN